LSNGAMVPGVADLWGRDSKEQLRTLVSPEQLRTQLTQVHQPLPKSVYPVTIVAVIARFMVLV